MKILGFLGSPKVNGLCGKLLRKVLEGTEECGAATKCYDLITCNIKYCKGCGTCYLKNPGLPIGKCPLEDDVAGILREYIEADGYIFASPVYDVYVTALMKTFLERKIALTYRPKNSYGKLPGSRVPANFKKKASLIVTGNCSDELREIMGDPCFEAMEGHLAIEQVDTVDKFYVGDAETMTPERLTIKLDEAHQMGMRLAREIEKAQKEK